MGVLDVSWVHCDFLDIRGKLIFNEIGVNSNRSAYLLDHFHSCFYFIDQLCVGDVRDLVQPIHSILGHVQGEGVVIMVRDLVIEALHYIDQIDHVRAVIHGFPGGQSLQVHLGEFGKITKYEG